MAPGAAGFEAEFVVPSCPTSVATRLQWYMDRGGEPVDEVNVCYNGIAANRKSLEAILRIV